MTEFENEVAARLREVTENAALQEAAANLLQE